MKGERLHTSTSGCLLLIGLLVAGQFAAMAHAYSHDPGSGQPGACAACVATGQLASGVVDSGRVDPPIPADPRYLTQRTAEFASQRPYSPRQRAPPSITTL